MSKKIDVFIIDDDARNLRYYQAIINESDMMRCIGSTTNSEKAVDIVITTQPDVVLVDYALYPTSGFEITTCLQDELPTLPVILLGGRASLQEHADAVGAAAYIPLPITPRKLLDTIQAVMSQDSTS